MVWIIISITSALLLVIILDWMIIGFAVPVKRNRKREYEKQYMLKVKNRMDYQKTTEALELRQMEGSFMQGFRIRYRAEQFFQGFCATRLSGEV